MSDNSAFIDHLVHLADPEGDRGPLAILRRGASGEARDLTRIYPLVLRWVDRHEEEDAYIQTASLFALFPTKPKDKSRGVSLGQALQKYFVETGHRQSIEDRFIALLRCHRDELNEHLRHAVNLVKDAKLPLRWTDIIDALRRWDEPEQSPNHPRRQWARDFWGFSRAQAPADSAEPAAKTGVVT